MIGAMAMMIIFQAMIIDKTRAARMMSFEDKDDAGKRIILTIMLKMIRKVVISETYIIKGKPADEDDDDDNDNDNDDDTMVR